VPGRRDYRDCVRPGPIRGRFLVRMPARTSASDRACTRASSHGSHFSSARTRFVDGESSPRVVSRSASGDVVGDPTPKPL
jgi:hypothetical protein